MNIPTIWLNIQGDSVKLEDIQNKDKFYSARNWEQVEKIVRTIEHNKKKELAENEKASEAQEMAN